MWIIITLLINIRLNQALQIETNSLVEDFDAAMQFLQYATCITVISDDFPRELRLQENTTYQFFTHSAEVAMYQNVPEAYILIFEDVQEIRQSLELFKNYSRKLQTYFIVIPKRSLTEEMMKMMFDGIKGLKLKNLLLVQGDGVFFKKYYSDEIERFNARVKNGDYNGYNLSVSMFPSDILVAKRGGKYYGVDPRVFTTIANKLNFNITYYEPPGNSRFGIRFPNGTSTGAIFELYAGNVDIAGNQVFLKQYNTPEMLFTTTISSDKLCVVVPKAKKVPVWMNMFSIYSFSIWILLFLTIICAYVYLLFLMVEEGRYLIGAATVFIEISRMIFNYPQHRRCSSVSYRIFQAFMLLFITIFSTTFQSSLVTVIKMPKTYPEINTLEELDKSGYIPTITSMSLADTFSFSTSPHMQSLDKKLLINTGSVSEVFLERKTKMKIAETVEKIKTGQTTQHVMKECPKEYLLSYMVRGDAFFYDDVNWVVGAIFEAGLVKKWSGESVVFALYSKTDDRNKNDINEVDTDGFSLSDMQLGFYFWMFGCVISSAVFLFEMYL